jgi:heavy metal efflux system protein
MIQRLVRAAVHAPLLIISAALVLLGGGLYAYDRLDIEAYPNPVPPMIEIITQPTGSGAEEVERFVTVPLETALAGMPGLEHVRSQSLFGLSDVKCYFSWSTAYKDARQEVLNRLQMADLPAGLQPTLSPWSPIGEIYRYVLRGDGYSLTDLKSAQDWILEKQFRQVPGVVDVVSFGGNTKQYHVEIDPVRLRAYNLTLTQVTNAIAAANKNVGGQYLTQGEQSYVVRGVGLIQSTRDIRDIVVAEVHGTPVRVRELASVAVGAAPRLGIVGRDADADVVQGIVLMAYGGNTMETLKGVHARLDLIAHNHILPPGMHIEASYDRSRLVSVTTHTVIENLLVGLGLVTLVLYLFLGHARAALLTALNIPLALMGAFIGIVATGTPANLISLGAVDFGIVVDSTVIMMENLFRHLHRSGGGSVRTRIVAAAAEVGPPMFSSTLIIGVAFIPLFTLSGVAGVIFAPMAQTYAFAIGGAMILALTLTPTLAALFIRGRAPAPGAGPLPLAELPAELPAVSDGGPLTEGDADAESSRFMRIVEALYRPLFRFGLRHKGAAVGLGLVPVAVAAAVLGHLGGEFMPKLEEGNFWIRASLPTSISLERSSQYVGHMRAIVMGCPGETADCPTSERAFPEVETVISQVGRPDDGTDVSGFSNIELFAPLRAHDTWRHGITKPELTRQMGARLREAFPGVVFNFSQAISDNVEEAISGVKGENTIKVVGPDLRVNQARATEIMSAISQVPGITDLGMFTSLGQPGIRITPDRAACARFGLNAGDVEGVVEAAVGGQAVTQVFEGEKRFDLTVRWAEAYRRDITAIRRIVIPAPDGAQVPLAELAQIIEEDGPVVVFREDHQRYTPVKFSVRGRDLASTIAEGQARVASAVKLPYDTRLEWAGEINQLNETTRRLMVIVPLTLLIIGFLVYMSVKNVRDTLIVLLGVPVAASGGVLALALTGSPLSISAAMGFISILGIAVQDALIVVSYAQQLWREGQPLEAGARLAAERGLRPVLMTAVVAMLGLLPAALSTGIGSETQKPLAIVVIGGALSLALLPRLMHAPLLVLSRSRWRRS